MRRWGRLVKKNQRKSLLIWRPTCKRLTRKMPFLILFLTISSQEIEKRRLQHTWSSTRHGWTSTSPLQRHPTTTWFAWMSQAPWEGDKFQAASQAVHDFAEEAKVINHGTASAVSLVMFNDNSRVACNKTPLEKHSECTGSITYEGGGTTFDRPLQDAMRLIEEGKDNYDKLFIMFYTDGQASYPNKEVEDMKGLMAKFPDKLDFFGISESEADALTKICEQLYPSSPLSEALLVTSEASTNLHSHAADLAPHEHGICSGMSLDMMPVSRAGLQPFSNSKTPPCSTGKRWSYLPGLADHRDRMDYFLLCLPHNCSWRSWSCRKLNMSWFASIRSICPKFQQLWITHVLPGFERHFARPWLSCVAGTCYAGIWWFSLEALGLEKVDDLGVVELYETHTWALHGSIRRLHACLWKLYFFDVFQEFRSKSYHILMPYGSQNLPNPSFGSVSCARRSLLVQLLGVFQSGSSQNFSKILV